MPGNDVGFGHMNAAGRATGQPRGANLALRASMPPVSLHANMAPPRKKSLGDVLREARIAKDLGLRELARQLDKSPSYISDIENDRRVPSEEVLAQLAKILGLDFEKLMALAGRLGDTTRRLVEKNPEAVALFRKLSSLPPKDFRRVAKQVDELTEEPKPKK